MSRQKSKGYDEDLDKEIKSVSDLSRGQESELDRVLNRLQLERQSRSKRPRDTQPRVAQSTPLRERGMLLALLLVVSLAVFGALAPTFASTRPLVPTGQGSSRAALIDPLSVTDPDPSFISNVTRTLSLAGYAVDYYGPSQVTVELFRGLAMDNYRMIILRAHTALFYGIPTGFSIVTSELYSESEHVYEQLMGQVAPALVRPGNLYFAITSNFISEAMQGSFQGTVVVAMGCSSLQGSHYLATSFVDKGAAAFVGWDDAVSAWYTDLETRNFLSSLAHGQPIGEALQSAGGRDPVYRGQLNVLDPNWVTQEQFNNRLTRLGEWAALILLGLIATRMLIKKEKHEPNREKTAGS